ncbi:hypothetical protein R1flu_013531 [Riccia fluitans]|uniref:Uncharacterized protein n=1 Tax=Riccia fluitans TaxID=41844 RepID=A0ABD1YDW5_9MARC
MVVVTIVVVVGIGHPNAVRPSHTKPGGSLSDYPRHVNHRGDAEAYHMTCWTVLPSDTVNTAVHGPARYFALVSILGRLIGSSTYLVPYSSTTSTKGSPPLPRRRMG